MGELCSRFGISRETGYVTAREVLGMQPSSRGL